AIRLPAVRHRDPLVRPKLKKGRGNMQRGKVAPRAASGGSAATPRPTRGTKQKGEQIERQAKRIEGNGVNLYSGGFPAVAGLSMSIEPNQVTALIGSSGCGKTTVLRSLNRMHELNPGARVEGEIKLDGVDIYGSDVDPVEVRRLVGMVFQAPNPFPTM